jgi:hypothetical protein
MYLWTRDCAKYYISLRLFGKRLCVTRLSYLGLIVSMSFKIMITMCKKLVRINRTAASIIIYIHDVIRSC